MRRLGAVLALLAVAALLPTSCAKKPAVTLVLLDPCLKEAGTSFKDTANYTEIAVFKGGCPTDPELASGDTRKAVFSGVAAKGQALPTVGDLDKAKYGFAAIMRDASCGVIGFGCTVADLNNIREVRVAVRAWTQPDRTKTCVPLKGQGCPAPLTCDNGKCVGSKDGGGEGAGKGCDLSLIASGGLPPLSVSDSGTAQMSGPTVAASTAGFVIGYRTQVAGTLYAHAALLTKSGTINPPSTLSLAACPGQSPADGVGLAFSGTNGLMALALPDCDTKGAGAYFMSVDANAQLSALKLARSPNQFQDLTLARTHSLSGTGAPDLYNFVYRATLPPVNGNPSPPQMQLAQLHGNSFGGGVKSVFGAEPALFGMVASTPQIEALLGQVPSKTAVEFDVASPGADAGSAHRFLLPLSDWGAVTAWDDRAAAIAPGAGSGLTLQAATASGGDIGKITLTGDQFSSGDIVALRDHLIVVGSEAQQLTVYRIDGAQGGTTTPDSGTPPQDSGTTQEAGQPEAGQPEAGQPEAGQPEAGQPEAGQPEAGQPDASTQQEAGPPPKDAGQSSGALAIGTKQTMAISQFSLPDAGRTFDGHQVSIAASGDEVAVVWRSKLNPAASAPGGWALLKCSQ